MDDGLTETSLDDQDDDWDTGSEVFRQPLLSAHLRIASSTLLRRSGGDDLKSGVDDGVGEGRDKPHMCIQNSASNLLGSEDQVPCDEALRCCSVSPGSRDATVFRGSRGTRQSLDPEGHQMPTALCPSPSSSSSSPSPFAAPLAACSTVPSASPSLVINAAAAVADCSNDGGACKQSEPLTWDAASRYDWRKSVTGSICIPVVYKSIEQACGDVLALQEIGGRIFVKELKRAGLALRVGVQPGHELVSIRIGATPPKPPTGGAHCMKDLEQWGRETACTRRVALFFMGFVGAFPAEVRVSTPAITDPFGITTSDEVWQDSVFEVAEQVTFRPASSSLLFAATPTAATSKAHHHQHQPQHQQQHLQQHQQHQQQQQQHQHHQSHHHHYPYPHPHPHPHPADAVGPSGVHVPQHPTDFPEEEQEPVWTEPSQPEADAAGGPGSLSSNEERRAAAAATVAAATASASTTASTTSSNLHSNAIVAAAAAVGVALRFRDALPVDAAAGATAAAAAAAAAGAGPAEPGDGDGVAVSEPAPGAGVGAGAGAGEVATYVTLAPTLPWQDSLSATSTHCQDEVMEECRSEGSFAEGPPGIFEVEREAARQLLLEAWTSLPLRSRMGVPLLLGRHQPEHQQQQQQQPHLPNSPCAGALSPHSSLNPNHGTSAGGGIMSPTASAPAAYGSPYGSARGGNMQAGLSSSGANNGLNGVNGLSSLNSISLGSARFNGRGPGGLDVAGESPRRRGMRNDISFGRSRTRSSPRGLNGKATRQELSLYDVLMGSCCVADDRSLPVSDPLSGWCMNTDAPAAAPSRPRPSPHFPSESRSASETQHPLAPSKESSSMGVAGGQQYQEFSPTASFSPVLSTV